MRRAASPFIVTAGLQQGRAHARTTPSSSCCPCPATPSLRPEHPVDAQRSTRHPQPVQPRVPGQPCGFRGHRSRGCPAGHHRRDGRLHGFFTTTDLASGQWLACAAVGSSIRSSASPPNPHFASAPDAVGPKSDCRPMRGYAGLRQQLGPSVRRARLVTGAAGSDRLITRSIEQTGWSLAQHALDPRWTRDLSPLRDCARSSDDNQEKP
jgi:hypothetical protein